MPSSIDSELVRVLIPRLETTGTQKKICFLADGGELFMRYADAGIHPVAVVNVIIYAHDVARERLIEACLPDRDNCNYVVFIRWLSYMD